MPRRSLGSLFSRVDDVLSQGGLLFVVTPSESLKTSSINSSSKTLFVRTDSRLHAHNKLNIHASALQKKVRALHLFDGSHKSIKNPPKYLSEGERKVVLWNVVFMRKCFIPDERGGVSKFRNQHVVVRNRRTNEINEHYFLPVPFQAFHLGHKQNRPAP